MSKVIVAQNGVVINIVNYVPDDPTAEVFNWLVDDTYAVNVGDPFDPKDWQTSQNNPMTQADYVSGQVLFNHENRLRAIVLAIRAITSTVSGAQAANGAGLPTNAQSQPVTAAQFKNAVKGLLP